jgi:hypothetical protein
MTKRGRDEPGRAAESDEEVLPDISDDDAPVAQKSKLAKDWPKGSVLEARVLPCSRC